MAEIKNYTLNFVYGRRAVRARFPNGTCVCGVGSGACAWGQGCAGGLAKA